MQMKGFFWVKNQFNALRLEISKIVTWKITFMDIYAFTIPAVAFCATF